MNNIDSLELERSKGNLAQHAWDNFIADFIADKRKVLFDAFQNVAVTQVEDLLEIRRTLTTLNALEVEIKSVIDTGKMASKMIDKETEH